MVISCQSYHAGDCLQKDTDNSSDSDTMNLAAALVHSRADGANPTSTKSAKKETTTKQGDKTKATAEQMRMAELINIKKEDPKLKEKLKKVMDATQKTMEEAYLALHDSEFDPNRAVNLLLEGSVETEWSTSSKKKKPKTQGEAKPAKNKPQSFQVPTQPRESWDPLNAKPSVGFRGYNSRRKKGGRDFRDKGSSFQVRSNAERGPRLNSLHNRNNDQSLNTTSIQSRTFERAVPPAPRPLYTWDPNRPIAAVLNQNREYDWDLEEYTGSLAKSLVYTSSKLNQPPKFNFSPATKLPTYVDSFIKPTLPSIPLPLEVYDAPIRVKPKKNLPVSLPPPITSCCTSVPEALDTRPPPIGPNPTELSNVEITEEAHEANVDKSPCKPSGSSETCLPLPADKPPFSAQAVPNSAGRLEEQFKSLDLKDSSSDATNLSLQPNNFSTSKLAENRTTNLNKGESSYHTFSGSSGAAGSLPTASLPLRNDSISEIPANSQKLEQAPLFRFQYGSGPSVTTIQSKNTSFDQNPYYASSGGISGWTSNVCSQYRRSSYVTQPSQLGPVEPSLSTSYQNVLGTQSYTSGSQSFNASNTLPTSSYTIPYQAYNSSSQHKSTIAPFTRTSLKDFKSGKSFSTKPAVPTASKPPTNQSLSSTKSTTEPKSTVHSNMPPMIGHQPSMYYGQSSIPFYQPPVYYQDMQLMQQQRLGAPMSNAYYEQGYLPLARDGVLYRNDRLLSNPESTQPMPHGHQMGASSYSGLSTIFGSETEHYLNPAQTRENTRGMTSMNSSSNDPTDVSSKQDDVTQKKNEYD